MFFFVIFTLAQACSSGMSDSMYFRNLEKSSSVSCMWKWYGKGSLVVATLVLNRQHPPELERCLVGSQKPSLLFETKDCLLQRGPDLTPGERERERGCNLRDDEVSKSIYLIFGNVSVNCVILCKESVISQSLQKPTKP